MEKKLCPSMSSLVKVIRHSIGEPGYVALMAGEMQECRPDVKSPLNLHFASTSGVD